MIEISLLPPIIQEQILMVKQGETIQFSYNGELFGDLTPKAKTDSKPQDSLMATAGLWQGLGIDGLEYQEKLRSEWVREWEK